MKNLIYTSILLLLLSSCTVKQMASSIITVDYRPYSQSGFFITESNSVNFEYTPLSNVQSYISTGYEKEKGDEIPKKEIDNVYGNRYEGKIKVISATAQKAVDLLVDNAKSQGANAIINLKITPIYSTSSGFSFIQGYSASGMAIKR
ncbi:heavy metal-binding domain-containing protein [Pedobacter sp. BS3]|uniref:heavy metal-binding domain-containing protein n=1 Tax=Pedobacter sp. BS3 TaxID=2567937 RepID=UPI0011EEEEBD|nr:heavy metal-binding domain-containing protein [Pedobacter sp. BS3]TZF84057.1 heavy metal-binding domain-containing protein [Pedobacter sp. BS3]